MPPVILRLIATIALVGACTHTDASARRADSAAPTTTSSATGDVPSAAPRAAATGATGAVPKDSISEQADRGRILGDSTATLWVIMASDFQCPYCKQWHDTQFAGVLKNYVNTGRVRMAFLNMPLSIHHNAVPAAEAAMCASVQNKFWPMHEALFASQGSWGELPDPQPKFDSLATSVGVDMARWHSCVTSHATLALIQADHDRARQVGVNSTPTFFVGKQTLTSADANVAAAIDEALKAAPAKP